MQGSFVQKKLAAWLLRQTSASSIRRVAFANGAIASEIGNVRAENQDKAVIIKGVDHRGHSFAAAVVADGIGGMSNGAQCASLGIASFVSALTEASQIRDSNPREWMRRAAHASNKAVFSQYNGTGGTTFVAIVVSHGNEPVWASAGDSRIYSFNGEKLQQLSIDDTIAGQLKKTGPLSPEHTKILQFVGMGNEFKPHIETLGDIAHQSAILTTDGVHYLATNSEWFSNVIQNAPEFGTAAKRLVDLAKWCGGTDNATIAIIPLQIQFELCLDENDCSLGVWDAYGELQLQLGAPQLRNQRAYVDKMHSETQADRPATNENITSENFVEESNVKKRQAKTPRKKPASRKKKSDVKDDAKENNPQLDIKFSSKLEQ